MKSFTIIFLFAFLGNFTTLFAQNVIPTFDPPWNTPPQGGTNFTIYGIDNVPDLYGDIVNPELVIFFAGNQFMVVDDLILEFKKQYPQYQRIFVETLPPGILAKQIQSKSLVIGNLKIELQPDIFTNGKAEMANFEKEGWFTETHAYAKNKLAIMVYKNNPLGIKSFKDFADEKIRISMPNPAWESIGKRIEQAYEKAGSTELREKIMNEKVKDGSTYLTKIHHRETPLRILNKEADAGPVWYSEVYYQKMLNHPVDMVELAEQDNIYTEYVAGIMKDAPHKQAAKDFMAFMQSSQGKAIYQKYGFTLP